MKRIKCCVLLATSLLQACASTASWPWAAVNDPSRSLSDFKLCKHGDEFTCKDSDALFAMQQANSFCRSVQNYYENGANDVSSMQTGIAIAGTLAGAVFAPISTGNAAIAFSGLSGSANALQAAIDKTYSGIQMNHRRMAVYNAIVQGNTAINQGATPFDKVAAAIQMTGLCATVSASADAAMLNALASTPASAALTLSSSGSNSLKPKDNNTASNNTASSPAPATATTPP